MTTRNRIGVIILYILIAIVVYYILYRWYRYSQCKNKGARVKVLSGQPLGDLIPCNFWKDNNNAGY